jgi:hypothetical protein
MKNRLIFCFLGFFLMSGIAQSQPVKPTISQPSNNQINVPLIPGFSIYLNTGFLDSILVEIDSTASFNSVGKKSYKSYSKVCANCAILPKIQFAMSQTWYVRARAWRSGLQGAWSNANKFTTASSALPIYNASPSYDFVAVMPEFLYRFSGTNVLYQVSETADFASPLIIGQVFSHDSFEGKDGDNMYARLRGLPQNKTLYMRSRYFLRKDTAAWGPTHTFTLKYKPVITGGGVVNSLVVFPSFNWAIYAYSNAVDTSVFYEFQRASDSLFTNPTTFKTNEFSNSVVLKPGANFIRYRVIHRSLTTAWSNVVKYTTNDVLPAPILSSQGNAFRTAQANLGPNLSVIQWQADTTTKFNSSRLVSWDSTYKPLNANRYFPLVSDDFAKFRNCYLRYRTGNGTDWMSWSAPSVSMYWQLQGSTQNQNFSLSQQFDFFPMNGVVGYYILADIDSTFKTAKAFSSSLNTTTMNVVLNDIQLDYPTVYYKVYARSSKGLSTPRTYKITNTIVPTIWGPGSGQSFEETVPYSIAGKSGLADMEFQVAKDAAFTKIDGAFVSANGGNTGNLPVSGPGDYFFRVRYINARSKGTWSVTVPFKITKVSQMAPPILRSPSNGAVNIDSKKSKFVWNPVPGATQYLISIFATSTSKLLYQNFTDSTSIWVGDLPANLGCQWTVLAMGDKISKQYSATWKFTTNAMVSTQTEAGSFDGLTVFPIPANDLIWVRAQGEENLSTMRVFDALGNCIYCRAEASPSNIGSMPQTLEINVQDWPQGVYYLQAGSSRVRFVVTH